MTHPPNHHRIQWLRRAKDLLWLLMSRAALLERLHPRRRPSVEAADALEPEFAECEAELRRLCADLRQLESTDPPLGGRALVRAEVEPVLQCVIVALVLTRLSRSFEDEADTIGAIAALAAGDDPTGALVVRDAFRDGGCLRPCVHIERRSSNIDRWRVGLTEQSLAVALGQTPDAEQMALSVHCEFPDLRRKW